MVVDTSLFIEFLRAKKKTETTFYRIPDTTQIYISSVTLYELMMGATSDEKIKDIKLLTDDLPVLPFDEEVAVNASGIYHRLRKSNKMIGFRDIFIAATCLVNDLSLKTLNLKHFMRVEGLIVQE